MKGIWLSGYQTEAELDEDLRDAGVEKTLGRPYFALGRYGWQGVLPESDDRWRKLMALAVVRDCAPRTIWEFYEATEAELDASDLVHATITMTPQGDTGPDRGNEYDYSEACPMCHAGARSLPPFRISSRDLPKWHLLTSTYDSDILVTGELLDMLGAIADSGPWLLPVEDRRTGHPLPWRAIEPRAVLPRMALETRGITQAAVRPGHPEFSPCPKCRRDEFGKADVEATVLAFDRAEIVSRCSAWLNPSTGMPDIAATWERTGPGTRPTVPGARPRVPPPFLVLGQQVARAFRQYAGSRVRLTPVTLL